MEELALVRDLSIVWFAALVFGAFCVRLKLPVIAGCIIAGIAIGPFGAKLIAETHQIQVLAEMGVALLLFALGVELSIRKVLSSAGKTGLSAACQIGFTVLAAWLIADAFGLIPSPAVGIVFGFICALSSTAVVTKLLVDRAETETPHGRTIVPMLLFQDLALIPVVALLPLLHQPAGGSLLPLVFAFAKAALLIVLVFVGAVTVVPRLFAAISRTNSRELFLLAVISLCLGVALLSKHLGVSLALGAFLGGIMVSEHPYGHQVLSEITPLRDLFATVFFVSVGMLLDPLFIAAHAWEVVFFVLLLLIGKTMIAAASAWIATRSLWTSLLVGLGLGQIGEFSFVLATLANSDGLLPQALYNLFFAGAVVTLVLSPALISAAPFVLSRALARLPLAGIASANDGSEPMRLRNHLILCGFGRMGRSIGLTLKAHDVPLLVIELNGETREELEYSGIEHIYGDAFSHFVLSKANIQHASCVVITVPDPVVALNIIRFTRKENQNANIIVRTNRMENVELFKSAGADTVLQPEYEASIEATKLALRAIGRPPEQILDAVRDIRQQWRA